MPRLSVIIVTYNPGDMIFKCLESVHSASTSLDVEVIVVDNASSDGTSERVRSRFRHVRVIARLDNRGFAAGCNVGLAAAKGDYLLLLNPDVIVQPETFDKMIRFMEDQPQVGIIGPRVYDGQNRVALTAYPSYSPAMILWQYLGFDRVFPYIVYGRYRKQCEQSSESFEAETVQGSCFMIRRQVYGEIGGLDESFFLFCEEPDFCERARTHGWTVYYVPDAHIVHFESSTVSRYLAARVRSYHLCPLTYFRKRGQIHAVWMLRLGFSLELSIKLVLRLAQVLAGRTEYTLHMKTYQTTMKELWTH